MRSYSTQQNVNTKMLCRKVGSNLILNTPKINDRNQKIDLKLLFGLIHDSTKQFPQILQRYFFDWSIDNFQSLIDYTKFSTETQWRLVTAACKVCPKYTKGIIVRLHPQEVTNWHSVTVEQKENVPCMLHARLWMQFMIVVSLHHSHTKSILSEQRKMEAKVL